MGRAKKILKFLLYIVLFPLFLIYWGLKSQTGKLAKAVVILVGLFLLPFWTAGIFAILSPSKPTKGPLPTPSVEPSPTTSVTPTPTEQATEKTVKVTRVIDGDTIKIETGESVRYIGIDAAEEGCFAEEATAKNKRLVEGKEVRLEKDISETDKYNRLLRYVYVDNLFVNDYLVRNGYAQVATYPPDVKYQDQFREAEREAKENNRGLWAEGACVTPTPKVKSATPPPPQTEGYTCDCSKPCLQMSSCDEAYYQLNTCGCSARDSDKDGVPCESICPGG